MICSKSKRGRIKTINKTGVNHKNEMTNNGKYNTFSDRKVFCKFFIKIVSTFFRLYFFYKKKRALQMSEKL